MLGEFFTDFVPKMLDSYLDTQDSVRKQMETFSVPTQWMDATRQMKVPVFNPFAAFQPATGTASEKSAAMEETQNPEEVEELKERLKDLEERMNQMQSGSK